MGSGSLMTMACPGIEAIASLFIEHVAGIFGE